MRLDVDGNGGDISRSEARSVTIRFLAVIALIAGLMIPALLVNVAVGDREGYYNRALDRIASAWAARQVILGPVLAIPYTATSADGKTRSSRVLIMPEILDAQISSIHEIRRRGIFEAPVLTAQANLSGNFAPVPLGDLEERFGKLRPDQATLVVGVSDARGLGDATLAWNGVGLESSGSGELGPTQDSFESPLAQAAFESGGEFTVSLTLRYVGRLGVMLIGDRSALAMASDWPHPSFDGRFLPDDHSVTDSGFQASWSSIALARGYQSILSADEWNLDGSARHDIHPGSSSLYGAEAESVGYSVFEPVTLYTQISRTLKYGILFIVLTLVSVLCIELFTRNRLHIVQYGIVGIGLVIFHLLLLSLAEHIGFDLAFLAATCLLTAMTAGYVWLATRDHAMALIVGGIMALLYVSLFTILQLEQYSLLVGTVLLVMLLGALMLATGGLSKGVGGIGFAAQDRSAPTGTTD